MQTTDDIIFESRDVEIFNIPDIKTKLNTLQNYFFPRLQRLMDTALLFVREVYNIDPLEKYSFIYRPSHRKDAKVNADYNEVFIGISGRRDAKRQLKVVRPDGTNYAFHPSSLCFKVLPTGEMYVEFQPFGHYVDVGYIERVKEFLTENYNTFSIFMNNGKLSYEGGDDFDPVINRLKDEHGFRLLSGNMYFPIENQSAIFDLIVSFALLFPVLDACHDIAEGTVPTFITHFDNFKAWMANSEENEQEDIGPNETVTQPPELDSYRFVRARLWYQVLMKDNWTCCSCKRSAREHGIILHVDHILPRSLGGKDELENLQTLCLKCNIGKSNKDTTDLRA